MEGDGVAQGGGVANPLAGGKKRPPRVVEGMQLSAALLESLSPEEEAELKWEEVEWDEERDGSENSDADFDEDLFERLPGPRDLTSLSFDEDGLEGGVVDGTGARSEGKSWVGLGSLVRCEPTPGKPGKENSQSANQPPNLAPFFPCFSPPG